MCITLAAATLCNNLGLSSEWCVSEAIRMLELAEAHEQERIARIQAGIDQRIEHQGGTPYNGSTS